MSRPSPAMVVACIALVVALSGTAVAARTLITSSGQVKNNIITSADLRNGKAVNVNDLTPAARRALSVAGTPGAPGAAGARGDAGPQGEAGAKGDKGDTGTPDPSNFYDKAASDGRFINDTETAFDSARLLGLPGSGYASGVYGTINANSGPSARNLIAGGRRVIAKGTLGQPLVGIDGIGQVNLSCEDPTESTLTYINASSGQQDVHVNPGNAVPFFMPLGDGDSTAITNADTAGEADTVVVQAGSGLTSGIAADAKIATFVVSVVNGPAGSVDNCHAMGHAVANVVDPPLR